MEGTELFNPGLTTLDDLFGSFSHTTLYSPPYSNAPSNETAHLRERTLFRCKGLPFQSRLASSQDYSGFSQPAFILTLPALILTHLQSYAARHEQHHQPILSNQSINSIPPITR